MKSDKWYKYATIVECRLNRSVYQSSSSPENIFKTYLTAAGFNEISVEERHFSFDFEIIHNLRTYFFAQHEHLNQIEEDVRMDLFNDFVQFNIRINLEFDECLDKYVYRYKTIVAYAKKCF